jgi:hypothetical protein
MRESLLAFHVKRRAATSSRSERISTVGAWRPGRLRLRASDRCHRGQGLRKVNADMERSTVGDRRRVKHVWTCKEAVGQVGGPAACDQLPGPSGGTPAAAVPNGFLLPTCPVSTTPDRLTEKVWHGRTRRERDQARLWSTQA